MKTSTTLTRMIGTNTRRLRRQKRGLTGAPYERRRLGLRGLSELQGDPLRPGLALQVAKTVMRAGA